MEVYYTSFPRFPAPTLLTLSIARYAPPPLIDLSCADPPWIRIILRLLSSFTFVSIGCSFQGLQ